MTQIVRLLVVLVFLFVTRLVHYVLDCLPVLQQTRHPVVAHGSDRLVVVFVVAPSPLAFHQVAATFSKRVHHLREHPCHQNFLQ